MYKRSLLTKYNNRPNIRIYPYDENEDMKLVDRFEALYKATDLHLYRKDYHYALETGRLPLGIKTLEECTVKYRSDRGLY